MDNNKLSINFHSVDHSDALVFELREKLVNFLEKHDHQLTRLDWTFEKDYCKKSRGKEIFKSKVHLHGKMKKEIFLEKTDEDIFKTISPLLKSLNIKMTKAFS